MSETETVDPEKSWRPPPAPEPAFEVIVDFEGDAGVARRRRRNWRPTIEALMSGKVLFMADEDLADGHVKYLTVALSRRSKGERLHVQRERRGGRLGRLLWTEKEAK